MDGHPFRDPPPTYPLAGTKLAPASRKAGFVAILVFSLLWNGVVAVMLLTLTRSGEWWMLAFLSVFVIVGLLVFVITIHRFLTLFNPTVELHVSEPRPALGETLEIRWRVLGKASRLRGLDIEITGAEVATYRHGTDTTTDTSVFFRERLAATRDPREIAEGTGKVEIPARAVPSFTGDNNKIVWAITIEGDIPRWPDIDDTFPLTVVASKHARAARSAA